MPSADKFIQCLFVTLLAFYDQQLIIYLVPSLSHSSIVDVGWPAANVPFFVPKTADRTLSPAVFCQPQAQSLAYVLVSDLGLSASGFRPEAGVWVRLGSLSQPVRARLFLKYLVIKQLISIFALRTDWL